MIPRFLFVSQRKPELRSWETCSHLTDAGRDTAFDGGVGIDYRLGSAGVKKETIVFVVYGDGYIDLTALPLNLDGIDKMMIRQDEFFGVKSLLRIGFDAQQAQQ